MIWSGFIIGLLGSLHCVGMCGPIALALPTAGNSKTSKVMGSLLYSSGRIITYSALGVVVGLIGESIAFAGYQQWLSVALGITMIVFALAGSHLFIKIPGYQKMLNKVKARLSVYLKRNTFGALFGIGILNGLLPCGLIYVALLGAIGTGDLLHASLYMMLFGAGTVPLLLAVNLGGKLLPLGFRQRITKAVPVFVIIIGVLLIVRGANLGIPYISPRVENNIVHSCCERK